MGVVTSYKWDPQRLAFLVEQCELSEGKICEACGLSSKSLRDYLAGACTPTLPNLIKMADFFCVPVDYLIGRVSYYDADLVRKDFKHSFLCLRHDAYEKYLISRKKNVSRPIDDSREILAVWPYNLVDAIFKTPTEDILTKDQIDGLTNAIDTLSEREKKWIYLYYLDGLTLRQIGDIYSIGPERVRQVLAKAVRKLRHPSRAKAIQMGAKLAAAEAYVTTKEAEIRGRTALITEQADALKAAEEALQRVFQPQWEFSIDELDLTTHSYNCLMRANIRTLSDLAEALEKGTAIRISMIGKKSLKEICDKVQALTGVSYHHVYGLDASQSA